MYAVSKYSELWNGAGLVLPETQYHYLPYLHSTKMESQHP